MKKYLLLLVLVTLTNIANSGPIKSSCNNEKLLFNKQQLSSDTQNTYIESDASEFSKVGIYTLNGNASMLSDKYYLFADKININKTNKTAIANGNVKFQDKLTMFTANSASVKKRKNENYVTLKNIKFNYPADKINGTAEKVIIDGNIQKFTAVDYSLCPLGNTDWLINADEININTNKNEGIAKNATIKLFGLPIFYSPYYKWRLKGRESGFLLPSFSTYNERQGKQDSGYSIEMPYYFNIAADKDLLLTLNHLSTRGEVLAGKYRQLITDTNNKITGNFEINANYLNRDKITNKQRWLLKSKLNSTINDKINLNIATNRVSDKNYLNDTAHEDNSTKSLNSNIDLNYKNDSNNITMRIFAEDQQLINNGVATYTKAPEITINKNIQTNDRNVNLSVVRTNFKHKDANTSNHKTGVRTNAQATFSRIIKTDSYSIAPSLTFATTNYNINNNANHRRSINNFHLDYKLFLERSTTILDTELTQTLTPRITYNYSPKKNQSKLPNFDSTIKNESYANLFSGKKFTGTDRINNANNITVGVESDFIDAISGQSYLTLKIAQEFYLDNIGMNIDGTFSNQRKYSNIAAVANFSLNDFNFTNSLQYNPENNKIAKYNNAISYIKRPRKFVSIINNRDKNDKSIGISGAYPINQKIHIFGAINRSLAKSTTNKQTIGMAYESCCWAVRVAHFKTHIGDNKYDNVTQFELVLKGLASTSTSLSKRIRKNIPNYLANLNDY